MNQVVAIFYLERGKCDTYCDSVSGRSRLDKKSSFRSKRSTFGYTLLHGIDKLCTKTVEQYKKLFNFERLSLSKS